MRLVRTLTVLSIPLSIDWSVEKEQGLGLCSMKEDFHPLVLVFTEILPESPFIMYDISSLFFPSFNPVSIINADESSSFCLHFN